MNHLAIVVWTDRLSSSATKTTASISLLYSDIKLVAGEMTVWAGWRRRQLLLLRDAEHSWEECAAPRLPTHAVRPELQDAISVPANRISCY